MQPWLILTRKLPRHLNHGNALSSIVNVLPYISRTKTRRAIVELDAFFRLRRQFSCPSRHFISVRSDTADSQPADKLSHNVTQEEKDYYKKTADQGRARQIRTPWQREGPDTPPAEKDSSKKAMSEGKRVIMDDEGCYG